MATNYPSSIQTFGDPISTDTLSGHAALHTDINDTVEAIQNKLGVDGDTDVTTVDRRVALLELEITPTGSLMMFAGSSAPSGWLLCNGAEVPRTGIYADLFAVVGTTYGVGNGSTTFNVPDLRNRAPVGSGSSYTLGQEFGLTTDSFTIGSGNLPPHTHTLNDHTHSLNGHTHSLNNHTHSLNDHTHDVDPSEVTVTTASNNGYVVNRLIGYTGSYVALYDGNNNGYGDGLDGYGTYKAGGVFPGMAISGSDFSHEHEVTVNVGNTPSTGPSNNSTGGNNDSTGGNNDNTGGNNNDTSNGGFANSSISVDIIQPSLGINFIIKV